MDSSKNKLFLFGDSFTEGHTSDNNFSWYKEWYAYLGNKFPKNWYELLSDKLDYEYINFGTAGNSNPEIFETFCKNSHLINENDIVLLQWSYMHRFRWAIKKILDNNTEVNSWLKYSASIPYTDYDKNHFLSKTTYEEIMINRTNILYEKELLNYENLIEEYAKSKKFNVFFWGVDENIIYRLQPQKLINKKYLCIFDIESKIEYLNGLGHRSALLNYILELGGKLIVDETNGKIGDGTHLGEKGHEIQSEIFYNHIIKYRNSYE